MPNWTFLTNHGQVLVCIAKQPMSTAREIAATVGITERAAQRIIDDLENEGYVTRRREGRRNHYEVHASLPMRHPAQKGHAIGELLAVLLSEPLVPPPTPQSDEQADKS